MSGDPEQDYFADGMVEDITTGLSRIKWLFVIARNSSFIYKGKAIDVRQVGRELGVRYILEGGVRKAGQRLRVTAQLVEAETGAHLWAEKFDGELKDMFELQDQIAERVVGVVEPSVRKSEIERSRRKRPESLDAYDLYLRSLPYLTPLSVANAPMAAELLTNALKLDPNFAAAHAHLAWCHQLRFHVGSDEADRSAALKHARVAIASDVDDATALAAGALVIGLLAHDTVAALAAIERAVSVNPSAAAAYFHGAFLYGLWGHSVSATSYAQRALRLSPFDPLAYHAHMALTFAAIEEERYDEAVVHGAKLAQVSPSFQDHVLLYAAALGLAGHMEEARQACARALEIDPSYRMRRAAENTRPATELLEKFFRIGRLLGVPE
jgi:adenylate cyclase